MRGLFVTATDTDAGKTVITGAIAAALKARGIDAGVFKPLASGCVEDGCGNLVAEDAVFLFKAAGLRQNRQAMLNTVCLRPALAPAVAARQDGAAIDIEEVISRCRCAGRNFEQILVEGVGGMAVPLWEDYTVADLMVKLGLPAIIVVRPCLGAINHTVLTAWYAGQRGIKVAGIIVNQYNEEQAGILEHSNIEYIERLAKLPVLGRFPVSESISVQGAKVDGLADLAERHLDIDRLLAAMEGKYND